MSSLLFLALACGQLDYTPAFALDYRAIAHSPAIVQPPAPARNTADWSRGIPREHWTIAEQSRPVFVWINYRCPSSADQVSGIHRHVTAMLINGRIETAPQVVIMRPDGRGWLVYERTVAARDCCASALSNAPQPAFAAPRGGA